MKEIFRLVCVMVTMMITSSCNKDGVITQPVEEHYRAKTESSKADWSAVYDYTPAPGQFIGDTRTGGFSGKESTMADAIAYAEERLAKGTFVSLGGFGGYVVAGFDHSIDNEVGYDIAIKGNAFDGSSEPGIVYVMQDANGNGKPDDEWYELRGSETGKAETLRNYSITYYRPAEEGQPVVWSDSEGNEGEIDYLRQYHSQPCYYPTWIKADSYTLSGSCLKAQNYDKSGYGTMWILPAYDWGYADNFSSQDCLEKDKKVNLFDISNAIDTEGDGVELKYIDFVKIQTACNTESGWLGEMSTEVCGIYDYTMRE